MRSCRTLDIEQAAGRATESRGATMKFGTGLRWRGTPVSPHVRTTIDQLLDDARHGLDRLDPLATLDAIRAGATLIDIRSESQITQDGVVPGALVISRNVLEWRLD